MASKTASAARPYEGKPVGHMRMTFEVTQNVPLVPTTTGTTIGAMVDEQLAEHDRARHQSGGEIGTLTRILIVLPNEENEGE